METQTKYNYLLRCARTFTSLIVATVVVRLDITVESESTVVIDLMTLQSLISGYIQSSNKRWIEGYNCIESSSIMYVDTMNDSRSSSCCQDVSTLAVYDLRKSCSFASRLPSPPRYAEKLNAATSTWKSIDDTYVFPIIARPRRDKWQLRRQIINHEATVCDSHRCDTRSIGQSTDRRLPAGNY
jgi:hypothetical protein